MPSREPATPLEAALREYVEARSSSILEARKALGLGDVDARAMLFLAENEGASPGELRANLGITSAGVTTLVDRLIERDAVRREAHPGDRRMIQLFVTVDFDQTPWSTLSGFDDRVMASVRSMSEKDADELADAISALTVDGRGGSDQDLQTA